jgi:hypothetical protein
VRGTPALLILAALTAMILVGCGASGGSAQSSEGQQGPVSTVSPEQKTQDAGAPGQTAGGKLGHPALGSADAPVVLIEYGDYQ